MGEKIILHCMTAKQWDIIKEQSFWGQNMLDAEGFIHCSTIEFFWRVAPNFSDIQEDLVLLCIDENKLIPPVKYEDGDNCGRFYPHVYGLINSDAVVAVLPYRKDAQGNYIKNPEFATIENK